MEENGVGTGSNDVTASASACPTPPPTRVQNTCRSNPPDYVIEYLIRKYDPDVVSFGDEEYWVAQERGRSPRRSVVTWYAQNVIPRLARTGRLDLVVEFLPDDDILNQELDHFYRIGELSRARTPRLLEVVEGLSLPEPGIRALLFMARKHGVRLHGGRGSWKDFKSFVVGTDSEVDKYGRIVRDTTVRKVNELRARGLKVATLNGHVHNDRIPTPEDAPYAFGAELATAPGGTYMEIDLFSKITVRNRADFKPGVARMSAIVARLMPHATTEIRKPDCINMAPDHPGPLSYAFLLP